MQRVMSKARDGREKHGKCGARIIPACDHSTDVT